MADPVFGLDPIRRILMEAERERIVAPFQLVATNHCGFCGFDYPPGNVPTSGTLLRHAAECEKHPMYAFILLASDLLRVSEMRDYGLHMKERARELLRGLERP